MYEAAVIKFAMYSKQYAVCIKYSCLVVKDEFSSHQCLSCLLTILNDRMPHQFGHLIHGRVQLHHGFADTAAQKFVLPLGRKFKYIAFFLSHSSDLQYPTVEVSLLYHLVVVVQLQHNIRGALENVLGVSINLNLIENKRLVPGWVQCCS